MPFNFLFGVFVEIGGREAAPIAAGAPDLRKTTTKSPLQQVTGKLNPSIV